MKRSNSKTFYILCTYVLYVLYEIKASEVGFLIDTRLFVANYCNVFADRMDGNSFLVALTVESASDLSS